MALALLLALRLTSLAHPPGGDQGLYRYVAQRVTAGDVPYRDAFEQKPPAIFGAYAAVGLVWPHPSMVAGADLVVAALVAWLLVRVGRQTIGGRVGEGAAALFLLLGDPGIQRLGGMHVRAQCETFVALAVTASLALTWRSEPRRAHLAAAGVGIALAFWLKYNALAFALPIALAAVLTAGGPLDRRRMGMVLGWIAAGAAGASLLFVMYFVAAGALTDLWLGTVIYNLRYSAETYTGPFDVVRYIALMPVERARVDGLWFVGLLGVLLLLFDFRRHRTTTIVVAAWIAAAMVSIALNGSRGLPQYFLQAAPALALAGAAGLASAWRQRGTPLMRGLVVAALLAGAWRVGVETVPLYQPRMFGLPQSVANVMDDARFLTGRLPRTAYLERFDRGDSGKYSPMAVERLARHIVDTTPPAERVYVFGFASGGVLARARRESASRFFWSRPVVLEFAAGRPGYGSAGLLDDLRSNTPALVALQKHDWGLAEAETPDSIEFFMNHPALRAWLEGGYVPDYEDAAFVVWRRKG